MGTRITVISDTHGRHQEVDLPGGDLLIHCGDMFDLFGDTPGVADLDDWFGRQSYGRILCTGGNHDRELQSGLAWRPQPYRNASFLQDQLVNFHGFKIFGSPWVPDLPRHAFFKGNAALGKPH